MKIIGVGDNVCDVYVSHGLLYPGGQALNVSVFAAMLGMPAAYMGVFGLDALGGHVRRSLRQMGVDAVRCRQVDAPNGYALVSHEAGDRVFLGSNRGGALRDAPLCLDAEDLAVIASCRLLHTSNNSYLDGELAKLDALPTEVSYDFSGAWRDLTRAKAVCPHIDYAFLSLRPEEHALLKPIATRFHRMGARHVILTMGAQGAWYSAGEALLHMPPEPVDAKDTLGAGDSFAAAFLTAMLQTGDPKGALTRAATFSAACCLRDGAFGCPAPVDDAMLAQMRRDALPARVYPTLTQQQLEVEAQ